MLKVENGAGISSNIEAVIIARQAKQDGRSIPIAPCETVDPQGKMNSCPKITKEDPDKLTKLCTDRTGLLPNNGVMECPLQKGVLRRTDLK